MATRRRRAALQAWIDETEALLRQQAGDHPEDPAPDCACGGPGNGDATTRTLVPGPAARARRWVSVHPG